MNKKMNYLYMIICCSENNEARDNEDGENGERWRGHPNVMTSDLVTSFDRAVRVI